MSTVAAVVAWLTVTGGATLLVVYLVAGGARAVEPDDLPGAQTGELHGGATASGGLEHGRTSLRLGALGAHAGIGIAAAAVVTAVAAGGIQETTLALALALVALVGGASIGVSQYVRWRRQRERAEGAPEERMPTPLVWLHGGAALTTVVLVAAALVGTIID